MLSKPGIGPEKADKLDSTRVRILPYFVKIWLGSSIYWQKSCLSGRPYNLTRRGKQVKTGVGIDVGIRR